MLAELQLADQKKRADKLKQRDNKVVQQENKSRERVAKPAQQDNKLIADLHDFAGDIKIEDLNRNKKRKLNEISGGPSSTAADV